MSNWHPVYEAEVLRPDYEFAAGRLKDYFIDALIAHVRTVGQLAQPQLPDRDERIAQLERELAAVREEPAPEFTGEFEDFYFTIQHRLEQKLDPATVSLLRIGLSRNDLDMTVYRLHARDRAVALANALLELRRSLIELAGQHTETVIIAHTHHQPAQPISLAHYLSGVESGLARDHKRLLGALERLNLSPMGAAALAGSSHLLDREYTARLLGFSAPVENTYDAVGASDWQTELAAVVQVSAVALSRVLHDLLYWASRGFITLADGLVQGSSIMPQKRNPVALEHARARFSKATGVAMAILFSSHNIPYGDLNDPGPDIQASLEKTLDEYASGVALLSACMRGLEVDVAAWRNKANTGDTTATELADVLSQRHQLPFQQSHKVVAQLVRDMKAAGRPLLDAKPEDLSRAGGPQVEQEALSEALSALAFIERRRTYGGPNPGVVREHLSRAATRLEADCQQAGKLDRDFRLASRELGAKRKEQ